MAEANEQPASSLEEAPKKLDKGRGVVVKINPLLGITLGGVNIPGHGRFRGGERITKEQFNKIEKDARHRPTYRAPEGFPLLVKKEEE